MYTKIISERFYRKLQTVEMYMINWKAINKTFTKYFKCGKQIPRVKVLPVTEEALQGRARDKKLGVSSLIRSMAKD